MRLAVTGGAGFIGRPIVEALRSAGHEVTIMDIADPDGERVIPHVDILDFEQLKAALSGMDAVYHLAGPVLESARRDPFGCSRLQALGTLNVLEACLVVAVKKVILASSFYVYDGLPADGIVNEVSPLDPARMELFGALKLGAEQLAHAYHRKHGIEFVILRFGSAFGLGEGSNLVQTFLRFGMQGEVLDIWGKGVRKNQYTYIQDIAAGALLALQAQNQVFNLIAPEETSTGQLAQLMRDRYGFEVKFLEDKPEGADFPYMSSRKAIRDLGWTTTPLEEAIDSLVAEARRTQSDSSGPVLAGQTRPR